MKKEDKVKSKKKNVTLALGENYNIPEYATVKFLETNNKIVIKNNWKIPNNLKAFRRLPGNRYFNTKNQKIEEFKDRKYKSKKAIRRNMNRLRTLISLYFSEHHNTYFITLTCRDEIKDDKEIKVKWDKFIRKLKRKFKKYNLLYIYKFEQQKNGKWHIHFLVRDFDNKEISVNNEEVKELWNEGGSCTKKVRKSKGNYDEEDIEKVENYMCKIEQTNKVPNGARLYGTSNNVKMPKAVKMSNREAQQRIKDAGATLRAERTILVKMENYILNKHKREIYTKKKNSVKINKFERKDEKWN